MCIENGCKKRPYYNKEGETKGLYCSAHKQVGMVNVVNKKCLHEGCNVHPIYNKEGETKGLYCSTHKQAGMVDVKHKKCLHEGCNVIPNYNKEGETKGLYCFAHKQAVMVDVVNKRCLHEGCNVRPSYNKDGETKGLYCSAHKQAGMVDVVSKTCIQDGCNVIPYYNKEGETKGLYCFAHKQAGMVNVEAKKCLHEGCNVQPKYNKEGETKGLYCSAHKQTGMVDVKNQSCKSEWCSTQVQHKYDGYCRFCFMHLFPDKPVSRNYKTKEYAVVEYVKTKFPNLDWIADKIVVGGCSKRRPDLMLDLLYQIVIIEVDENQHTDYDCSCENKRIMELSQDLGHRPIVFIRFNPDDYEQNYESISSCWGQNKQGICVVKKSKMEEWSQRLNALEEQIRYWINPEHTTEKTIETIQLFYDV